MAVRFQITIGCDDADLLTALRSAALGGVTGRRWDGGRRMITADAEGNRSGVT